MVFSSCYGIHGVFGWWNTETPNSKHQVSWYAGFPPEADQLSEEETQRLKPET